MSTNQIILSLALDQHAAMDHARKDRTEGVGKLTELQRRTLKLWRGDAKSLKVGGMEARAKYRQRGQAPV